MAQQVTITCDKCGKSWPVFSMAEGRRILFTHKCKDGKKGEVAWPTQQT